MPKDFYLEKVTPLIQPTDFTCGQTTVAMIAGVTVDEVIEVMGNAKGTQVGDFTRALRHYGFDVGRDIELPHPAERTSRSRLPSCAILTVTKYREDDDFNHAVLLNRAIVYDPALGAGIPLSTYSTNLLPRDGRWINQYLKIKGRLS